jgi:hypothetical protein
MTIIAMPAAAKIAGIRWQLVRPSQGSRSGYTGRRQVVAAPWHGRWAASVELSTIVGEENVRAWRSFLAKLQGQINTFRLVAVEGPQTAAASISTTAGASAGATQITVSGGGVLSEGMLITVADQLLQVTSASSTIIQFEPQLRNAISSGATVFTREPTALVALSSDVTGWSVGKGKVYSIAFDVEEAF